MEKYQQTNTFWVNPPIRGEEHNEPDSLGVSFPEPSYKDGIGIPDKIVPINGAINYRLLDAINIDWDHAAIPWATRITKWSGSGTPNEYESDYEYNQPAEGGWTDGTIKETEDIVDILNYLIYRVVSLDFFMDHWNDDQLQPPLLKLVNHRTDWYDNGTEDTADDINPDIVDYDELISSSDRSLDNRFTVRNSGLIINLYPYLVSNYWEDPDITSSYKTKLFDSTNKHRPGVVMCDTGWDAQRQKIYCGIDNRKIVEGNENFDMFDVETISNSNQIKFISRNKHIIDGLVQTSIEIIEDSTDGTHEGGVETIDTLISGTDTSHTQYLYKLPIVAYKCLNAEKYPYTTFDVIQTLLRFKHAGVQNTLEYVKIKHSKFKPQFDPEFARVTFGITIAKSQDPVNGYAAGSSLYTVTIYKGDNTLKDLSLVNKSVINTDRQGNPIQVSFNDSHNNEVKVNTYTTILSVPEHKSDYNNSATRAFYKSEINFEAEFGPSYDATHYGSDEEILKKSFVYPYFVVKLDNTSTIDYMDVCNSINVDAYKYIYSDKFDSEHNESFTLFANDKYGTITYEKQDNVWKYFYLPPAKENIQFDTTHNYNLKLFALMYYPIDDITTNRILNPLWAELSINIPDESYDDESSDSGNSSGS